MLDQQVDELRIGRARVPAGIAVDDGHAVHRRQGPQQPLPPIDHLLERLRIAGINPRVAIEEMPLFERCLGRLAVVGSDVRAQGQIDAHFVFPVQHVDHRGDLVDVRLIAGRQGIGHRFEHRPDKNGVVAKPLEPVGIASPILDRPGSRRVGMVVGPMLMNVHADDYVRRPGGLGPSGHAGACPKRIRDQPKNSLAGCHAYPFLHWYSTGSFGSFSCKVILSHSSSTGRCGFTAGSSVETGRAYNSLSIVFTRLME